MPDDGATGAAAALLDPAAFGLDDEMIAQGRRVFLSDCNFVAGAQVPRQIPPPGLPEIAFAGRSNVGKSSLINALTGRKSLARASNTPGRTQQINFFDLGGVLQLVDLPGYGYAKVSRGKSEAWNRMVQNFLSSRETLARLCVLVDGRHGVMEADRKAMAALDDARVPYFVVMTKADKMRPSALLAVKEKVEAYLKTCKGAFPYAFVTSAEKGEGIDELRGLLARPT